MKIEYKAGAIVLDNDKKRSLLAKPEVIYSFSRFSHSDQGTSA